MKEITVICKAQSGLLAEITSLMSEKGIDIRNLESHLAGDDLFLKLLLSDYDLGLSVLSEAGYNSIPHECVLIRLEDRPGALAQIARELSEASIDVRGISLVHQSEGHAAVAISSCDDTRVRELFSHLLIS